MKNKDIKEEVKISSLSDFLAREKDSAVVKKVLSEIDEIHLAGVLTDNTMDSVKYGKIISNLPIETIGKYNYLIRGFDYSLSIDLSEFQYGYGKVYVKDLLSIVYDDKIYKTFEQNFDANHGLFKDIDGNEINKRQIATGMKKFLNLYDEKKYKFSDPEIEKRLRKIISEYYEARDIPQFLIDRKNRIYNHDTKILIDEVGNLVDLEKIKKAPQIVHFLSHDEYLIYAPKRSMGVFISPQDILVDTSYNVDSVPTHEMLHYLSYNKFSNKMGVISRISKGKYKYTGINESITEFINQLTLGKEYIPGKCGYESAVVRLRAMLNLNIDGFDIDTIKKAYFNNDISLIKKPLEKATNNSEFVDFLLDYCFNEGTLKGKLDALDIALGDFITLIKQNGGN